MRLSVRDIALLAMGESTPKLNWNLTTCFKVRLLKMGKAEDMVEAPTTVPAVYMYQITFTRS